MPQDMEQMVPAAAAAWMQQEAVQEFQDWETVVA